MSRAHLVAATLPVLLMLPAGCGDDSVQLSERQQQVAQRGAEVMPFDLDATTHRFEKTDDGVVQVVVADDPTDRDQIALIRQHLRKEARRFARGDFSDPRAIHGKEMPGLEELSRRADQLDIRYRSLSDGAEITLSTSSPALKSALHAWASAQVEDHGRHADHG